MTHNTFAGFGAKPLGYPHHTKWADKKVHIVTNPETPIKPGDIIFCGQPCKDNAGNEYFMYHHKEARVKEVTEPRPAMGNHITDFKPVFQLITLV